MTPSDSQTILVVDGKDLSSVAAQLRTQLGAFPNPRVVSMVSDTNRITSLRGKITVLVAVSHD